MKREILCEKCAEHLKQHLRQSYEQQPDGDGVKFVKGILKILCICDNCGKQLLNHTPAVATSFYINPHGDFIGTYFPWEHEFLTITSEITARE